MLQDPEGDALADNFAAQWLNLRLLDRKKPDRGAIPDGGRELLDAMRQETLLFVNAVIREDRSILDFIDGKFTFVNGPLARHYGIPGVDGEEIQRVRTRRRAAQRHRDAGRDPDVSSYATRTSPVLRGKWVLENLLGTPPPPPPADVPPLEEADLGTAASMRQRLEQHRANPSLRAPATTRWIRIGFGLENYDAAGALAHQDGEFRHRHIGTLPDGTTFAGAKGLKQMLRRQSDAFTRNFTEKLLTYALGRGLERSDRAAVDEISRAGGGRTITSSRAWLSAIVNSRAVPDAKRSRWRSRMNPSKQPSRRDDAAGHGQPRLPCRSWMR